MPLNLEAGDTCFARCTGRLRDNPQYFAGLITQLNQDGSYGVLYLCDRKCLPCVDPSWVYPRAPDDTRPLLTGDDLNDAQQELRQVVKPHTTALEEEEEAAVAVVSEEPGVTTGESLPAPAPAPTRGKLRAPSFGPPGTAAAGRREGGGGRLPPPPVPTRRREGEGEPSPSPPLPPLPPRRATHPHPPLPARCLYGPECWSVDDQQRSHSTKVAAKLESPNERREWRRIVKEWYEASFRSELDELAQIRRTVDEATKEAAESECAAIEGSAESGRVLVDSAAVVERSASFAISEAAASVEFERAAAEAARNAEQERMQQMAGNETPGDAALAREITQLELFMQEAGQEIRDLQAAQVDGSIVKVRVDNMVSLRERYRALTGRSTPPAMSPTSSSSSSPPPPPSPQGVSATEGAAADANGVEKTGTDGVEAPAPTVAIDGVASSTPQSLSRSLQGPVTPVTGQKVVYFEDGTFMAVADDGVALLDGTGSESGGNGGTSPRRQAGVGVWSSDVQAAGAAVERWAEQLQLAGQESDAWAKDLLERRSSLDLKLGPLSSTLWFRASGMYSGWGSSAANDAVHDPAENEQPDFCARAFSEIDGQVVAAAKSPPPTTEAAPRRLVTIDTATMNVNSVIQHDGDGDGDGDENQNEHAHSVGHSTPELSPSPTDEVPSSWPPRRRTRSRARSLSHDLGDDDNSNDNDESPRQPLAHLVRTRRRRARSRGYSADAGVSPPNTLTFAERRREASLHLQSFYRTKLLAEKTKVIDVQQNQITSLKSQIAQLTGILSERDATLLRATDDGKRDSEALLEVSKSAAAAEAEFRLQQAACARQEERIATLTQQISGLETQLAETTVDPNAGEGTDETKSDQLKEKADTTTPTSAESTTRRTARRHSRSSIGFTARSSLFADDAIAGEGNDDSVCAPLCDVDDGKPSDVIALVCTQRLVGHRAAVRSLACTSDGQTLFTAGDDCCIKVWRPTHSDSDAPDAADKASVWANSQTLNLDGDLNPVACLVLSADERCLFSGGGDGVIQLWTLHDGTATTAVPPVSGEGIGPTEGEDHEPPSAMAVGVWRHTGVMAGHEGAVRCLLSVAQVDMPFGTTSGKGAVVSGGNDGALRLWDARTAKCLTTRHRHQGEVMNLAVCRTGDPDANASESVLAGGGRGLTAQQTPTPNKGPKAKPSTPPASPDWIDQGLDAAATFLKQPLATFVESTPDHVVALCSSSGHVETANCGSLKTIHRVHAHGGAATSLVSVSDQRRLYSGGTDCSIKVWEVDMAGNLLCQHTLNGHTSDIRALASSGANMFSGGRDMSIMAWDTETMVAERGFVGHTDTITALLAKGRLLFSASADYLVQVWQSEQDGEAPSDATQNVYDALTATVKQRDVR